MSLAYREPHEAEIAAAIANVLRSERAVGERLGSRAINARSTASDRRRAGKLLAVRRGNAYLYPAFQFADNAVVPAVEELAALADEHGWTQEDLVLWLCAPSRWLRDRRPVDLLGRDPQRVVAAARAKLATAW